MGCNSSKVSQPYQPRPKDIPIELDAVEECTVKDERETTDNTELTGGDIRGIITRALEEFLKEYKVYGQAIPPGSLEPIRREPTRREPIRVLEVKRNPEITVTPDDTGTFLTHGLLKTKYDLYAAVDRTTNRVVFLYQWEALGDQILVTCPYSQNPTAGSIIPCAETDITNALKERDPEKAVMQRLEKIITGNSEWAMDGPDNDFTISVPGEEFFWRDIEGFRDIMLTDNDRIKLVMQLEVVAASPVPLK